MSASNTAAAAKARRPVVGGWHRQILGVAAAAVVVSGCSADVPAGEPDQTVGAGTVQTEPPLDQEASDPADGGLCPAAWLDVVLQDEQMSEVSPSAFVIPEIGDEFVAEACVVGATFPDATMQWAVIPVTDAEVAGETITTNLVGAGFFSGGVPILEYQYGQFASVDGSRSATVGAYATADDIPEDSGALASFGRPIVVIVAASGEAAE